MNPQNQQNSLRRLYETGSSVFDLGDYDTFQEKMKKPESRQKFYSSLSQHYDLGDYKSFEGKVLGLLPSESPQQQYDDTWSGTGKRMLQGVASAAAAIPRGLNVGMAAIDVPISKISEAVGIKGERERGEKAYKYWAEKGKEVDKYLQGKLTERFGEIKPASPEQIGFEGLKPFEDPLGTANKLAKIFVENAPTTAMLGIGTMVNPVFGTAMLFGVEAGDAEQAFDELEAKGIKIDPSYRKAAATSVGALNAMLERVGFDQMFKAAKVPGLKAKLLQLLIAQTTESGTESLQQVNQILSRTGAQLTEKDVATMRNVFDKMLTALHENKKELEQSAIAGAVVGTGVSTITSGVNKKPFNELAQQRYGVPYDKLTKDQKKNINDQIEKSRKQYDDIDEFSNLFYNKPFSSFKPNEQDYIVNAFDRWRQRYGEKPAEPPKPKEEAKPAEPQAPPEPEIPKDLQDQLEKVSQELYQKKFSELGEEQQFAIAEELTKARAAANEKKFKEAVKRAVTPEEQKAKPAKETEQQFDAVSQEVYGKPFADITEEQQARITEEFDKAQKAEQDRKLKEVVRKTVAPKQPEVEKPKEETKAEPAVEKPVEQPAAEAEVKPEEPAKEEKPPTAEEFKKAQAIFDKAVAKANEQRIAEQGTPKVGDKVKVKGRNTQYEVIGISESGNIRLRGPKKETFAVKPSKIDVGVKGGQALIDLQKQFVRAELEKAGISKTIIDELAEPRRSPRPFTEEGDFRELTTRKGRIERAVEPPAQVKGKVDEISEAAVDFRNKEAELEKAKADIIEEVKARGGEVVVDTETGAFTVKLQPGKTKMGISDTLALQKLRREAAEAGAYSLATVGRGFEIAAAPEKIADAAPLQGSFADKIKEFVRRNQAYKEAGKAFDKAKAAAHDDLVDAYLAERAAGREPQAFKGISKAGVAVEVLTRRNRSAIEPDIEAGGRDFPKEVAQMKQEAAKRGVKGEPFLETRKAGAEKVARAEAAGTLIREQAAEYTPGQLEKEDLPEGKKPIYEQDEPYAPNYKKRPDASFKTNQAASQAVNAIGNNRRQGRVLLANAINAEAREKGAVSLIGKEVRTSDDVAVLAQVYRDPRWETLRYIFVKNGKIVHVTGVSNRLPAATAVFPVANEKEGIAWLNDLMKSTKADGYYILHNHPSGKPNPSPEDINMTKSLLGKVNGFKGHVIIDSNNYTVLVQPGDIGKLAKTTSGELNIGYNDDNIVEIRRLRFFGEELLLTPSTRGQANESLGLPIRNMIDIAEVGKRFKKEKGWAVLISSSKVGVRGIMEVDENLLQDKKRTPALLRKFARQTGAPSVFAYVSDEFFHRNHPRMAKAITEGFVVDVVSESGYSALDVLYIPNKRAEFGIREFVGREVKEGGAIPDKITVDGKERPARNSKGQLIHPTREGIINFWKWFGDSKVVDEQGRPLVMYHGTNSNFEKFDKSKIGTTTDDGFLGRGFYFSTDPNVTRSKTVSMPTYLLSNNPAVEKLKKWEQDKKELFHGKVTSKHDSVILDYSPVGYNHKEVMVKEPTQIKSATGNIGTFSPTEPSIVREDVSQYRSLLETAADKVQREQMSKDDEAARKIEKCR